MLSTRYMTAMDSSQQQQKMTSPQASGSRRVGSEKRDVIRSRSENRQRPHQHTDDAQDNPRWFRVVNRNEKWLGRFFGFAPKCRSVSVGFNKKTENPKPKPNPSRSVSRSVCRWNRLKSQYFKGFGVHVLVSHVTTRSYGSYMKMFYTRSYINRQGARGHTDSYEKMFNTNSYVNQVGGTRPCSFLYKKRIRYEAILIPGT